MDTHKKKKKAKPTQLYVSYTEAAKIIGCEVSTMSRRVDAGTVRGGEFPAYHKDEKGVFHETNLKIKVIDRSSIEEVKENL